MMEVAQILESIKSVPGSIAKKSILESHSGNEILKKVLRYGSDPFMPFHITKVPKTESRFPASSEITRWNSFFEVADLCAERSYTGNFAIKMMQDAFCIATKAEEAWMRKILKKHLSIGASTKTINKIFPGLIPTFDVSLAQKFDMKRLAGKEHVAVEPKLDGIRCFAIVENSEVKLFARSGKLITNFDKTIGKDLHVLGDGCYDGELMGEDFTSLMRQAYRKENVNTAGTYLSLFDYLPISEWRSHEATMTCDERYNELVKRVNRVENQRDSVFIKVIDRFYCEVDYDKIKKLHDDFVRDGFEGAMIKYLDAPYKFGRGFEVMKMKVFHDVDLPIQALLEGTGKHAGKLGSVKVLFNGVEVQIGSGFSDDLREAIWNDPDSFTGRLIEIRYQEVTQDGSLRFPTFVCFRNDR